MSGLSCLPFSFPPQVTTQALVLSGRLENTSFPRHFLMIRFQKSVTQSRPWLGCDCVMTKWRVCLTFWVTRCLGGEWARDGWSLGDFNRPRTLPSAHPEISRRWRGLVHTDTYSFPNLFICLGFIMVQPPVSAEWCWEPSYHDRNRFFSQENTLSYHESHNLKKNVDMGSSFAEGLRLGLLDLVNKNTRHPIKFGFQIY